MLTQKIGVIIKKSSDLLIISDENILLMISYLLSFFCYVSGKNQFKLFFFRLINLI